MHLDTCTFPHLHSHTCICTHTNTNAYVLTHTHTQCPYCHERLDVTKEKEKKEQDEIGASTAVEKAVAANVPAAPRSTCIDLTACEDEDEDEDDDDVLIIEHCAKEGGRGGRS